MSYPASGGLNPDRRTLMTMPQISPTLSPSVSYTITMRLEYPNLVGSLRRLGRRDSEPR